MFALLWLACTDPAAPDAPATSDAEDTTVDGLTEADTDTDTDADTDADTDTDTDTDTGTVDTESDAFDCSSLPALPVTYQTYQWAPPAEDFTFTADGEILAVVGGHLQTVEFGGAMQIRVPNLGDVRGTRILPDGRAALAHIETGSVLLVDPATGGQEVLASGLQNPNGIAIGDDGRVYVTASNRVMRLDPADFSQEVIAEVPGRSFDGISFSPDYTRLYFNEEVGRVHWVDLDANGDPGPVQDGPSVPMGAFSLLDGMAVDVCGNLYIAEMGRTVWRVTPTGAVDVVVTLSAGSIVPALNFGPSVGGWDDHTLYVQDFLGKMHAVDVGVPGKWEPHQP